jgi:hypothetical protein
MVYGDAELIDQHGRVLRPFPFSQPFDLWKLVHVADYIMQPTVFMRAARFHEAGGLDAGLRYALDWDLWIRLARFGPPLYVRELLAQTREHAATKTARGGFERFRELQSVLKRHEASPYVSPAAIAYGLDTLRRRWPVLFGPASAADVEEQKGRTWPRVFGPVHALLARAIDRQMNEAQGVYADGWVGACAHLALSWQGEAGRLSVCGRGPVAASRLGIELTARGRSARVNCRGTEAFRVSLAIPASRSATRIDLSLRSSVTHTFPDDRRGLAFRLDSVSFEAV